MTVAQIASAALKTYNPGEVFGLRDFDVDTKRQPTLTRWLNRQVEAKKIVRLSKGRYYKPRVSRFGELPLMVGEVIKDLLVKDGKLIGYISGVSAFAQLGLTTQISSAIEIGCRDYRRPVVRGNYKISFIQQSNPIQPENIRLLQLLDACRAFRTIPATTPAEVIRIISAIIQSFDTNDRTRLVELSLRYPPYVRALLGAMLEQSSSYSEDLMNSLNGVTTYKLSIPESVLPTKYNWNIK